MFPFLSSSSVPLPSSPIFIFVQWTTKPPFPWHNAKPKKNKPTPTISSVMGVGMMDALRRSNGKPSTIRTIIINHMLSTNPHQLMTLVQIQLRHCWLIPPILLHPTAVTLSSNVRRRHCRRALTAVDLKPFVRSNERCVCPIRLYPTPLRRPIIRVPN